MTAYDDIRAATTAAEVEHGSTLDDLAEAEAANNALLAEIAELKAALEECEGGDPDPPTGGIGPKLEPPAGKIYIGVQQEGGGYTGWLAENGNKAPHIFHRYSTSGATFVSALNSAPVGMIPLINFKPSGGMGLATYNAIVAGTHNAAIDQAANAARTYGKPMFVAIMHEPENDGTAAADPEYVAAYRHTALRMKAIAPNIVFVWNMMGAATHSSRYNGLYPGDDVVDWLAADLYIISNANVDTWGEFLNQAGWSTSPSGWYNWAKAKNKPLMLAEWGIGSVVVPATPTKMFGTAEMQNLVNNYPLLKALVYWNEAGLGGYQVSNPQWTGSGAAGLLGAWVRRPEFEFDISGVAK